MKTFYFNIQSKGGSGKSLLTYLQALKYQDDPTVYFVDFDSSVKSSLKQLKFLQGRKPARFALMSLLDNRDKLDRQLLFENLYQLSEKDFQHFYLDFGAPESDQLPALFSRDYTADEFLAVQQELDARFIFNIVIAGGSAYDPCTTYLEKITSITRDVFQTDLYLNETTFAGTPQLIDELHSFASRKNSGIAAVKLFGDFDISTAPHKGILEKINHGMGMEAYRFIEKIKIQKEIGRI